jgi:glycosyltransferase involved in cell wall biosynthesis
VIDHFDWEVIAARTEELYERIVRARR